MNIKKLSIAAILISAAAFGVSIYTLDKVNTTNKLLGEFLKSKSKIPSDKDSIITSELDEYITEEEKTINESSDFDVENLDEEATPVSEESVIESTGGIDYIKTEVNK